MYKYLTTFYNDFTAAEAIGRDAIKQLAAGIFKEQKHHVMLLTELVMVLNHKCWDWYYAQNDELSNLYSDLYYKYNDKALEFLEHRGNKNDIHYYITTLD